MNRWRSAHSAFFLLLSLAPIAGCVSEAARDPARNPLEPYRSAVEVSPLAIVSSKDDSHGARIKHNLVNNAAEAQVEITTWLRNASSALKTASVIYTIFDAEGKQIESTRATAIIPANADAESAGCLIVQAPHLWSGVDYPSRYRAAVELRDGDTLVERVIESIDFRSTSHPVTTHPSTSASSMRAAD